MKFEKLINRGVKINCRDSAKLTKKSLPTPFILNLRVYKIRDESGCAEWQLQACILKSSKGKIYMIISQRK